MDTLTYPTSTSGVRFGLKYIYDSTGYLIQQQDASAGTIFWFLNASNDSSLPTSEYLGNSVQVASSYTPWTNELIGRSEGSGGSTNNLQNLSYTWDLNGNLGQRQDLRQNLTEVFTPDALNRLSTVTLNGVQTLSVNYDAAGDIINKSDVSSTNYVYGDSHHPHAVTAAGGWSMSYDANGNMNSRAGGAISSYSYNLPNLINYNGSSAQFSYDANHQRWKQVASYAGTGETIHYVGPALQVVTRGTVTYYRHQMAAGSSTVVYTRGSDGSTGTYYATSDHLGSADLVMDSAANVLTRESFTPFGARRGSNWQGLPSTGDYSAFASTTRQGYTGHEMLDAVSLVHMNGRVYDPYLGRFLTADSVVQSLASSQAINPYAYAWNDPLKYTDPSGHSLLGDILGFLAAVVIIVAAPELGLPAILSEGGVATAAVAGFVGGFVGAAVSTGNLGAAFDAGVLGAITAGLFSIATSYVATLASEGSAWATEAGIIAHAGVGCVSAALSSGNCGKGALSAAIGEVADGYIANSKSLAQWGSGPEAAVAGLVGGVTSRVVGGSFTDGFSVAAAGYLFGPVVQASANGQSPVAALGDLVGKIWDLPNTIVGLIAGSFEYAAGLIVGTNPSISIGDNSIQFLGAPIGAQGGGALTLGNVQIFHDADPSDMFGTYRDPALLVEVGLHEEAHTYQSQVLGLFFLPAYLLFGGISSTNPFENSADNFGRFVGGPFSAFH